MIGMESLAHIGLEAMKLFRMIDAIENPRQVGVDKELDKWPKARFAAEADRFELWAVNLGVFVSGHGSLDYRTKDARSIRDTLHRFMKSLTLKYLNEETHPSMEEEDAPDTESEPESDMELLVDSVKDPIDRLFKLSIWIRNPATRLASLKAQNFQQIDEETNVNLLDVFEAYDHDHISSLFLQYKKHAALQENPTVPPVEEEENRHDEDEEGENSDHVWEPVRTVLLQHKNNIANDTESFLVRRIAQANVRRRQQFAYWRKHRDKLRQHTAAVTEQVPTSSLVQGPVQTSTGVKVDCGAPPAEALVQSVTTASRLNLPQMEKTMSTVSVSEYAPSARQPSKDVADFPPPPRIPLTEKFFECPYCFTLCSTALLAEKAWKAHLIHDLRPYVCTYEQCRNPDQLYDSRQDWIEHENSTHRRVFRCPEHEDHTFATLPAYQEHAREQHGGGSSSDESIFVSHAGESTLVEADRCCPVCSLAMETAQRIQGHIALHLERFALFSIPRSVGDDEDSAHAVGSADADLDSEGSRAEDLDMNLIFADEADYGVPPDDVPLDEGDETESDGELEPWAQRDKKINMLRGSLVENQTQLGEEHPDTLRTMDKLAKALMDDGRLEGAQQMYELGLRGYEKAWGPEDTSTLDTVHELGILYKSQGRFIDAEVMLKRALQGREKALGPEHMSTLDTVNNLGNIYTDQGRLKDAEAIQ
ncbi:hypothetical protein DL770_010187 [Monosporascus sp. CRB-9-2]|nr:hypothetical protein DL770_010187 [Monosporascus sp. CRB-9-2]